MESAGSDVRVETLFVGGGTPSCLPPALRERLLGAFSGLRCSEWTVESNPETLDEGFLDSCAQAGVTRLSVGIQSLNTRHLQALRRQATREQALAAIQLLKRRWKGELNLDFITGIPGQTVSRRAGRPLCAGRWVAGSRFTVPAHGGARDAAWKQWSMRAPSVSNRGEMDEELWLAGRDELVRRGFRQYEVSNFCPSGKGVPPQPALLADRPVCRGRARAQSPRYPRPGRLGRLGRVAGTSSRLSASRRRGTLRLPPGGEPLLGNGDRDDRTRRLSAGVHHDGPETDGRNSRGRRCAPGLGASFTDVFPGLWESWVSRGLAVPPDGALRLSAAWLAPAGSAARRSSGLEGEVIPMDLRLQWPKLHLCTMRDRVRRC